MARGSEVEIETIWGVTSSLSTTGMTATFGDGVATTETVAEQTGQMWEADGVGAQSEQK